MICNFIEHSSCFKRVARFKDNHAGKDEVYDLQSKEKKEEQCP